MGRRHLALSVRRATRREGEADPEILSDERSNGSHDVVIAAMITSVTGRPWPSDHLVSDLETAGLRQPCVVRWKVFTLPTETLVQRIGCLGGSDRTHLAAGLRRIVPT